jgi:hypothetical protein
MGIDNINIRRWKELVKAFMKLYKFDMDIAPDRSNLLVMEKEDNKSVREYAQRWSEKAAQVSPPLLRKIND